MKKIFIKGFIKNVAISSNTVYNLIGNLDINNYVISFKEDDGTEVSVRILKEELLIKRKNRDMTMEMNLKVNASSCFYETAGIKLQIQIQTLSLNIYEDGFHVTYKIENQDECEYQLHWEVQDEL